MSDVKNIYFVYPAVAFSFLGYREEWGSKEREIGSVFHMLCPRYMWPLTPTALLQPLGYAGSLDLYLSRRRCNSRFRCTQLFNTTLPSFLNNWNLLNGAQKLITFGYYGPDRKNMSRQNICTQNMRTLATAPIRLHRCAGWNEPLLTAHAQQDPFSHNNLWFGVTMTGHLKEGWFFYCLLIRLFNISGFPTFQSGVLRLYSRCAAHLFIYCQLHVTCYSYMYNFTETRFSVFYFYYYCLREPEK